MRRIIAVSTSALLAVGLAACGGDESTSDASGGVSVTEAWARSPMGDVGAVYFVVTNDGAEADRLTAAAAPDLGGTVEVHETTMSGGQAAMSPVDGVDIPAGGVVTFEPGGYHVMLTGLTSPLEVGSSITIVLTFEQAGDVEVQAEVRSFVEDGGMGATGASGSTGM
ncbi:MAG: copper chaperone PCu(A)C [Actinomycetota bacterium]